MNKNILVKSLLVCSMVVQLNAELLRDADTKIVTDTKTKLMWQDDAVGNKMDWETAIDTCENLMLGGYNDWRLPNIRELISIVDRSKTNLAISPTFTASTSYYYWSSTAFTADASFKWAVNFQNGDNLIYNKTDYKDYIRCVRTVQ